MNDVELINAVDSLASAIDELTGTIHGVKIEIFHFSECIDLLNDTLKRYIEKEEC